MVAFDYDTGSHYARHTSVHEPSFSYNIPDGSSYAKMDNYRFARYGRVAGFPIPLIQGILQFYIGLNSRVKSLNGCFNPY